MKRDKETRVNVGTLQAMRNKYLKKNIKSEKFHFHENNYLPTFSGVPSFFFIENK